MPTNKNTTKLGIAIDPTDPTGVDPLVEIDQLVEMLQNDEQRSADKEAQNHLERTEFASEFSRVCNEQVRPSMQAIVERLRHNGGGGVIEERAEDVTLRHKHRLTLWMSLEGEIDDVPREDRLPYLQFDADVDKRLVTVSEGDMWVGHRGNRSGKIGERTLPEITAALVTDEVLDILRRSVR